MLIIMVKVKIFSEKYELALFYLFKLLVVIYDL